jgi:hypothetical protein
MREPSFREAWYSPWMGGNALHPLLWEGCTTQLNPALGCTALALYDQTGQSAHCSIAGDATWSNDEKGLSIDTGSNGYLVFTAGDYHAGTVCTSPNRTVYSWSIWVKSTANGINLGLISRWQNSGGTYSWVVTWENTGVFWYQAGLSAATNYDCGINDGKWHHLCGVNDGVYSTMYCDGQFIAQASTAGSFTASNQPLVIGTYATAQYWPGKIGPFAFWNRPLSRQEVTLLATDPSIMNRLDRRNSRLFFQPPTYALTGAINSPVGGLSAAMTFTAPTYALTGSLTGPVGGLSASMTFAAPQFSLEGSITGPVGGLSAAMTFTAPTYALTGSLTGPVGGLSASMTFAAPQFSLEGSITGPVGGLSAAMTFTAPTYALTGSLTGPVGGLSASMTFAAPQFSLEGSITGPVGGLSAAMTFTAPTYALTGSLTGPVGGLSASMTFAQTGTWNGIIFAERFGVCEAIRGGIVDASRLTVAIAKGERHEL